MAAFGRLWEADQHYSLTRGVDLKGVATVLNADVPTTVRDYVHRVGRCARGGQSGTALTLCTYEEEPQLQKILQAQSAGAPEGSHETVQAKPSIFNQSINQ